MVFIAARASDGLSSVRVAQGHGGSNVGLISTSSTSDDQAQDPKNINIPKPSCWRYLVEGFHRIQHTFRRVPHVDSSAYAFMEFSNDLGRSTQMNLEGQLKWPWRVNSNELGGSTQMNFHLKVLNGRYVHWISFGLSACSWENKLRIRLSRQARWNAAYALTTL